MLQVLAVLLGAGQATAVPDAHDGGKSNEDSFCLFASLAIAE